MDETRYYRNSGLWLTAGCMCSDCYGTKTWLNNAKSMESSLVITSLIYWTQLQKPLTCPRRGKATGTSQTCIETRNSVETEAKLEETEVLLYTLLDVLLHFLFMSCTNIHMGVLKSLSSLIE